VGFLVASVSGSCLTVSEIEKRMRSQNLFKCAKGTTYRCGAAGFVTVPQPLEVQGIVSSDGKHARWLSVVQQHNLELVCLLHQKSGRLAAMLVVSGCQ